MWGFILGLLLGIAGKVIYDLFKEDQLPASMGLNTGRIEAMLDETRQTVRDLREEVRQAVGGEGSLQEKASRVAASAGSAVKEGIAAASAGKEAGSTEPKLMVTSSESGETQQPPAGQSGARGKSGQDESARGEGSTQTPSL